MQYSNLVSLFAVIQAKHGVAVHVLKKFIVHCPVLSEKAVDHNISKYPKLTLKAYKGDLPASNVNSYIVLPVPRRHEPGVPPSI